MEGKRRPGTGKSTLADVAKLVGVSAMTVSRALRAPEKVSDQLRQRIQQVIAELGYVPNLAASALASASSRLITLVVPSLKTPGCAVIFHTLQQVLLPQGYNILLSEADHSNSSGSDLIETLLAYNPAAIVQYNFDNSPGAQKVLLNAGVPVVEIGGVNKNPIGISVGCDYANAIKTLVSEMIHQGYRNIGLLCSHDEQNIFQQMLTGWNTAMLAVNRSPHRVVSTPLPPTFTTGHSLLPEILLTWPELDLLICTADDVACGAILACHSIGVAVPQQLAIAGIGGSELAAICSPTLTTVAVAYKEMASLAAEHLLALLKGNTVADISTIPARLIKRAST
ncbi:LacI family DNA-binding transcriptional regulator [Pantoea sp. B65]|uniref:LacI family DNA-binding transcriptional regulator n=1 Tax=Pantoea sp. B65 TaxID=2813359 RepID=UPI0039B447E7